MLDCTQIDLYLDSISKRGFVEISEALPLEIIDDVNRLIERPLNRPTTNGRRGYVQDGNIRYLHQTLSWGREIIDIYTHPVIIELASRHAQDAVHLSNYRIYRTFPSASATMPWHVDNKLDTYDDQKEQFETLMVAHDMGLILILYLSDVEDGGLQIVEQSHQWTYTREFWDDLEMEFADKIVTFNNRRRGTAILYDYRSIHRAKPYTGGAIRTSLFAQYSPSRMPAGEPILLNARDIANLSEMQQLVLNFGQAPTTENWPIGQPQEILGALGLDLKTQLLSKLQSKVKGLFR